MEWHQLMEYQITVSHVVGNGKFCMQEPSGEKLAYLAWVGGSINMYIVILRDNKVTNTRQHINPTNFLQPQCRTREL